MANQTFGKLFSKVATLDKSARVLAQLVAMHKQAAYERRQFVRESVGAIVKQAAAEGAASKAKSKAVEVAKGVGKGALNYAKSIPSVNQAITDVTRHGKQLVDTGKGLGRAAKAVVNPNTTDTDSYTWAPQLAAQSLNPKVDSNAARTMQEYLPPFMREPVSDVRSVEDSAAAANNAYINHMNNTQSKVDKYLRKLFPGK